MLVEPKASVEKTVSLRIDEDMFHTLKALSNRIDIGASSIMRLGIATLLLKARKNPPDSWEDLKNIL